MENAALKPAELLHKTPLHALHVSLGGKMVPFAGYDMPVQYGDMGVLKEHLHTRSHAGLFDVSHMGQAVLTAKDGDPARILEKLVPGDIAGLSAGQMRYTVLLNDKGGIVDDLMVTRWDERTLLLVVNAACKDKDFAYIRAKIGAETHLEYLGDRALLALQGPKAERALSALIPDAARLFFMTSFKTVYKGQPLYISRSGYTGEDGYEISLPAAFAESFTRELLANDDVKLIGLGARDSLRLEAGLCLYGHDLDEDTTPVEANLKWTIAKRRREEANFAGAEVILKQLADGTARLRVALKPEGKAPVREGAEIHAGGKKIGMVTSGGFGPTADAPVAMGYVDAAYAKNGTAVDAMVRGTPRPCTVAAAPFVKHNYKKD
ncbi:MAG: glycine cleavage system aminomethyltransferase GcvT [Alphaproteobacteria bacterium]|nr:glycine cleavage system aminomethyltransferase GcvT [Alphaproteobacteria bacterium]